MNTEVIVTSDGSHTLYVPHLQEHYHSVNGALQESDHVFVNMGLQAVRQSEIRVFEVGFGTGLNALLTALYALQQGQKVFYQAVERYPVIPEKLNELNYTHLLPPESKSLFKVIHQAAWGREEAVNEMFTLHKIQTDFTSHLFSESDAFNLVYFDAFAPDKQPEMWDEVLFKKLYDAMAIGGILVTYCAKGEIRRRLQRCGFSVERLPGPPGKREMLRALK